MPIMYCYRHSVELRLKHLWTVAGWLEKPTAQPLTGHDLRALWGKVKPILGQRVPPHRRGLSELDTAETVLQELADLDPQGVGCRYPESSVEVHPLRPDVTVNLHNVSTVMLELLEFLDDAAGGIVDELLKRRWPEG